MNWNGIRSLYDIVPMPGQSLSQDDWEEIFKSFNPPLPFLWRDGFVFYTLLVRMRALNKFLKETSKPTDDSVVINAEDALYALKIKNPDQRIIKYRDKYYLNRMDPRAISMSEDFCTDVPMLGSTEYDYLLEMHLKQNPGDAKWVELERLATKNYNSFKLYYDIDNKNLFDIKDDTTTKKLKLTRFCERNPSECRKLARTMNKSVDGKFAAPLLLKHRRELEDRCAQNSISDCENGMNPCKVTGYMKKACKFDRGELQKALLVISKHRKDNSVCKGRHEEWRSMHLCQEMSLLEQTLKHNLPLVLVVLGTGMHIASILSGGSLFGMKGASVVSGFRLYQGTQGYWKASRFLSLPMQEKGVVCRQIGLAILKGCTLALPTFLICQGVRILAMVHLSGGNAWDTITNDILFTGSSSTAFLKPSMVESILSAFEVARGGAQEEFLRGNDTNQLLGRCYDVCLDTFNELYRQFKMNENISNTRDYFSKSENARKYFVWMFSSLIFSVVHIINQLPGGQVKNAVLAQMMMTFVMGMLLSSFGEKKYTLEESADHYTQLKLQTIHFVHNFVAMSLALR